MVSTWRDRVPVVAALALACRLLACGNESDGGRSAATSGSGGSAVASSGAGNGGSPSMSGGAADGGSPSTSAGAGNGGSPSMSAGASNGGSPSMAGNGGSPSKAGNGGFTSPGAGTTSGGLPMTSVATCHGKTVELHFNQIGNAGYYNSHTCAKACYVDATGVACDTQLDEDPYHTCLKASDCPGIATSCRSTDPKHVAEWTPSGCFSGVCHWTTDVTKPCPPGASCQTATCEPDGVGGASGAGGASAGGVGGASGGSGP